MPVANKNPGAPSLVPTLVDVAKGGHSRHARTAPVFLAASLFLTFTITANATITGARDCNQTDYKFINNPTTTAALKKSGFPNPPTTICGAIDLPWLPTARVIQLWYLTKSDFVSLTFLQAKNSSQLWLVPITAAHPGAENNPHNIAALNDLLTTAAFKPNQTQLIDLALLYMAIVGHHTHDSSDSPTNPPADVTGTPASPIVTLHQLNSVSSTNPQPNWSLHFTTTAVLQLTSVTPDQTSH